MISLCNVVTKDSGPYLDVFFESVADKLRLISEVLLCNVSWEAGREADGEKCGVPFKEFALADVRPLRLSHASVSFEHGLGLHSCLDRASNDLVLISDHDLFFYSAVDEFYVNLMNEHELSLIGCAHYHGADVASRFFPNTVNMLVRKSHLPTPDFMSEHFVSDPFGMTEKRTWPGRYFWPLPIPGTEQSYPNPTGFYDTGHLLYLWAKERGLRWLSFLCSDFFNYTTLQWRGNIGQIKLPKSKLLYHQKNANSKFPEGLDTFLEQYRLHKEHGE